LCETSGEEGKPLLPFALAGLDSAYRVTGDWETALGVLERAIELERASGNPANRTLGMNLFVSGMTEAALGHFEAAHLQLDEALKLAEAADDIYRVGLKSVLRTHYRTMKGAFRFFKRLMPTACYPTQSATLAMLV
jgi:tetratricopeptide (TPR) repeat protein